MIGFFPIRTMLGSSSTPSSKPSSTLTAMSDMASPQRNVNGPIYKINLAKPSREEYRPAYPTRTDESQSIRHVLATLRLQYGSLKERPGQRSVQRSSEPGHVQHGLSITHSLSHARAA